MSKRRNPEVHTEPKKTYYQTRGKVHLVRHDPEMPPEIADTTWCGLKLENCNNFTSNVIDCTCQRCLMHMHPPQRRSGC